MRGCNTQRDIITDLFNNKADSTSYKVIYLTKKK